MISTVTSGDIYQWTDGDGDGSLWLSDSDVSSFSDFSGQVLWWAALSGASFHHSNLQGTNLMYAQLVGTNFGISNLGFTNLHGADLTSANLAFVNLSGADLSNVIVTDANLFLADLTNANLEDMVGWDDAFWMAASYNSETVLPAGMDPDTFGMIEVPAPPAIIFMAIGCLGLCKRRSISTR
ncbi:MAG: pentapeptide repeat-containing protein [Planctomycetota bacterium]|nr:pentapeptide repeat-containing protein [Planctomycetota bacterium]